MRETCLFTRIEPGVLRWSQRQSSEDKEKGVKSLSDTQRDPWKYKKYSVINKSLFLVDSKGTGLLVHSAVFRILTLILFLSLRSIKTGVYSLNILGFWAFIYIAPWTLSRASSIIISLSGLSVYLNTWGWFSILQELNIVFQTLLILPFLSGIKCEINEKRKGN